MDMTPLQLHLGKTTFFSLLKRIFGKVRNKAQKPTYNAPPAIIYRDRAVKLVIYVINLTTS